MEFNLTEFLGVGGKKNHYPFYVLFLQHFSRIVAFYNHTGSKHELEHFYKGNFFLSGFSLL